MQILIVEDERLIAEDLQETLYALGYDAPSIAATGEVALELVASEHPDLVLMDIHLPGAIDGVTAAERIRAQYAIPIVFLTAYADANTVRRAAESEPFGYVLKPFDEHDLRISLELAFAKYHAECALRRSHTVLEQNYIRLGESHAALAHRALEVDILNSLGGDLLRCTAIPAAYAVIIGATRKLFPGSAGGLYIRRGDPALLEPVTVWGGYQASPSFQLSDQTVPGSWIALGAPEQGCTCLVEECARGYLCIPLVAERALLGILRVKAPAGRGSASLERLTRALAEQAALGLANVQMREDLREQALRDPLTGLFNRRYMEENLERERSRAARSNYPIGLIIFDIDHFKRINDTYGHAAGDELLRAFSRCLLRSIRAEDIACRYGGEEFVLALPSASLAVTVARAEQIRVQIGALRVTYEQRELASVTVSAGVAIIDSSEVTVAQALAHADSALYRAKRAGRNRVEAA